MFCALLLPFALSQKNNNKRNYISSSDGFPLKPTSEHQNEDTFQHTAGSGLLPPRLLSEARPSARRLPRPPRRRGQRGDLAAREAPGLGRGLRRHTTRLEVWGTPVFVGGFKGKPEARPPFWGVAPFV